MQTIQVAYMQHRNELRMQLRFANVVQMNTHVRKIAGVRWSQTKKCWHLPATKAAFAQLQKDLPVGWVLQVQKEENAKQSGQASPQKLVKPVLQTSKKETTTSQKTIQSKPIVQTNAQNFVSHVSKAQKPATLTKPSVANIISPNNQKEIDRLIMHLQLKAYSPSTIRTYKNEFSVFVEIIQNKPVQDITVEELKRYFQYCAEKLKLTENTIHSRLNALKFYFEQVLGREKFFYPIPRPKKQMQLPNVLGEKEIEKLFNAIENKKHKAILFTAYSAGLRVSEVMNMQLKDIDSDRMQIFVQQGKGKKDRYVMLSPILLDVLRQYIKKQHPQPTKYLFEGAQKGEKYSTKSAQKVFQMAKEKAGIKKDVSFHSLRHSFATHLLENGIDIKYIKDLLGHFDIKTTERYIHVQKNQLVQIESPLDSLMKKVQIKF